VVLFLGALTLVMLASSPVCHVHYFVLSLPLVMALLAREWDRAGQMRLSPALCVLLLVQLVGNALPLIAGLELVKDAGLSLYTALALWATACVSLWRRAPLAAKPEAHLAKAA
jgi:heme A synthase